MPQTIIALTDGHAPAASALQGSRNVLTTLLLRMVEAQRQQRERSQLAELSDAALKDLGLSRADVWSELSKPGWRR